MFCSKCGKELGNDVAFCDACGTPVEAEEKAVEAVAAEEAVAETVEAAPQVENVQIPQAAAVEVKPVKKPSLKTLIIIGVAVVLSVVIAIVSISAISQAKYQKNMGTLRSEMYSAASDLEEFAILYAKVWYDTIFERSNTETYQYTHDSYGRFYDDFNDALEELSDDKQLETTIFLGEKVEMQQKMAELENPPKKYEAAYNAMNDMYIEYLSLANLVLDASGESYNSYSTKKNEAVDNFIDACERFDMVFE